MPTIFDNIDAHLFKGLEITLQSSKRADFCVGYFNLRGWRLLDSYIEEWPGSDSECCRLLVGMQKLPHDILREDLGRQAERHHPENQDNETAMRIKTQLAEQFRQQLIMGSPSNEDEAGLRKLAAQLMAKKVKVKLYLRHPLHAKLYLLFRKDDPNLKSVAFLGSSNLTFSGLSNQGELNVDILEQDACQKLEQWFNARWNDDLCLDISAELVDIINDSWARAELIPPYYIYLKMVYHLSQEARSGISEFTIPEIFENKLFDFQTAAVKIAAHHLNKRNGVLIGDVVGLGKTLMATALARIFDENFGLESLILCPKNLEPMWLDYWEEYGLRGRVLPVSRAIRELPKLRRYRLVIIDESHNLRNREGKRYRAIQEYIKANDCKVILLSATPYNKNYRDLSNQLGLFIEEDRDLGIRPEKLIKSIGVQEFEQRHQCLTRSLAAFEQSEEPDDWRDLMRLFLVRRTRGFIKTNYAKSDSKSGRKYLAFDDGTKAFFPDRTPKTLTFPMDENNPDAPYAKLFSEAVVDTINNLKLPRYGFGNYISSAPPEPPTADEAKLLQNLSRAGKRLMGFCRVGLFKRLESSGSAFLQSVERHILRNHVFLHALQTSQKLPLGTQDPAYFDTHNFDGDLENTAGTISDNDAPDNAGDITDARPSSSALRTEAEFKALAAEVYQLYAKKFHKRFKWLSPRLFKPGLQKDLEDDSNALLHVLQFCGEWDPAADSKLNALYELVAQRHNGEKVIVFSQFADTVRYIERRLLELGLENIAGVTGDVDNPTEFAWRLSPVSNHKRGTVPPEQELRVLISTDVLSEGQNLQDCAIVVNYDLPWAIIRLIQRAGRVDRIGQKSEVITCYSFLPAEGVERIIKLRERVLRRLRENAEVVGADESFFEEGMDKQKVLDLYHEKAGILDDEDDKEVDLASQAYEIWKVSTEANPKLKELIPAYPDVVFSSRHHVPGPANPEGVLVFLRTSEGNDALAYIDKNGASFTESQFDILKAAACSLDTPAQPHHEKHHELVQEALKHVAREEKRIGGHLGRKSGPRYRVYTRLKKYEEAMKGSLFEQAELPKALDRIYRYPLKQAAIDMLNIQLKSGVDDRRLAELVIALFEEDRLCMGETDSALQEPRIICSIGLFDGEK
ncbi:MAG: helicase-related protein [Candidatus Omnitrophota bacterium]